ncbi:MAG: hypothetical protein GWP09_02105, partial [Nitrospiraceae bacterium]|nr:hypothetical protein [Nitrospiraceae bacterium]
MNSNTNLIINRRTKRNIEKIESDSDNSLIDDFYSKIDSLIDTLNKTLPKRTKYDYWDINSEFITNEIIEVSDKHLSNTVATIKKRLSLRLFSGSRMGFAYTENFDKDFRKNLIDSAIDSLLSYNSIKSKKNEEEHQLYIGKSLKMSRATRQRVNSQNISFRDKINDNIEAQKSLNPSKMRISFLTNYVNTSKHKGYFSSNGDDLRQHLNYESYQAVATSFGKTIEQGYHKVGKQIGYEIKHYFPEVLETAQHMSEILQKAKIPKGGKFKVITSPSLTEVFIHEALGHASESDIVLNHQSCLQGKMNTRISKDYVDVFDDSTVPESWGSFFFDDEGIPAQKTPIIKKGILN